MGNLVFQATLGGQVNLVGPNTASTYNINVPAIAGTLVTTGDTGTVTNTMLASNVYTAPGTIGSGTPNTGAFTTLTLTNALGIAYGGTAATSFTGKSGNVAGLVFYNGTKLTNDATVTYVGYDTSTNTVQAKNLTISGTQTYADGSTQNTAATGFGFKNRIINGAMMIDQRNAGASVTPAGVETYTVDRFSYIGTQASKFTFQQNAGSVTPPAGFKNYLGFTVAAAVASPAAGDQFAVYHKVEGLNSADLDFGLATAATVTISFWVRSSLTGTFAGGLVNSAGNRSYVFNYTINSANTWEQKTVTIAGDTTGTWLTTNGIGIQLRLDLGSGTNQDGTASAWQAGDKMRTSSSVRVVSTVGATFYITGVQLEKGSTATSFDYRPYGTELALCQRYYYQAGSGSYLGGLYNNTSNGAVVMKHAVTMRVAPTVNYTIAGGGALNGTYLTTDTSTIYLSSNTPALSAFNASAEL